MERMYSNVHDGPVLIGLMLAVLLLLWWSGESSAEGGRNEAGNQVVASQPSPAHFRQHPGPCWTSCCHMTMGTSLAIVAQLTWLTVRIFLEAAFR
jgi:hypothetical protein